ncbi:MAG: hypothetical protein ACI9LM_005255 [Alteromonadaceae bacterium]|jgi:hypothetical protein
MECIVCLLNNKTVYFDWFNQNKRLLGGLYYYITINFIILINFNGFTSSSRQFYENRTIKNIFGSQSNITF